MLTEASVWLHYPTCCLTAVPQLVTTNRLWPQTHCQENFPLIEIIMSQQPLYGLTTCGRRTGSATLIWLPWNTVVHTAHIKQSWGTRWGGSSQVAPWRLSTASRSISALSSLHRLFLAISSTQHLARLIFVARWCHRPKNSVSEEFPCSNR